MNQFARAYFSLWAKNTFSWPWALAMGVAGLIGVVVSYAADSAPAWSSLANRAAWQLPSVLFILTLVPAAIHASYKLWSDAMHQFANKSDEAQDLKNQLSERVAYAQLAGFLSHFHRQATEDWVDMRPSNDQILAEQWRPKAKAWHATVKYALTEHGVGSADVNYFDVIGRLDTRRHDIPGVPEEVKIMWVRVERLQELVKKYEELSRR